MLMFCKYFVITAVGSSNENSMCFEFITTGDDSMEYFVREDKNCDSNTTRRLFFPIRTIGFGAPIKEGSNPQFHRILYWA